jgi:hypothetical protein
MMQLLKTLTNKPILTYIKIYKNLFSGLFIFGFVPARSALNALFICLFCSSWPCIFPSAIWYARPLPELFFYIIIFLPWFLDFF